MAVFHTQSRVWKCQDDVCKRTVSTDCQHYKADSISLSQYCVVQYSLVGAELDL